MCLLLPWADENQKKLFAVTVDHNLRSNSFQEANFVKKLCVEYRVDHSILKIKDQVAGNLQSWARENRYRLIAEWAYQKGIKSVFLGHTLDDQAETFLLRLARGSGIDGLSAMSPKSYRNGICWLRPLLNISRKDLRIFLDDQEIPYVDDPSNDQIGQSSSLPLKLSSTLVLLLMFCVGLYPSSQIYSSFDLLITVKINVLDRANINTT